VINKAVPVAEDYDVYNLDQTAGKVTAVTVTPRAGKSNGGLEISYRSSSTNVITTTPPPRAGTYAVSFNVAASSDGNWAPATNLFAGALEVKNAADGIVVQKIYLAGFAGTDADYNENNLQTVQLPLGADKAVKPTVDVFLGLKKLTPSTSLELADKDYTVEYEHNAEVTDEDNGIIATLKIQGRNEYAEYYTEAYFRIGQKSGPITIKWLDDNGNLTNAAVDGTNTVKLNKRQSLTVTNTSDSTAFTVVEWRLDGVKVSEEPTYEFIGNSKGKHYLTLLVQNTETGFLQNTTFTIEVQ